jgi:hypothetical protein
MTTFLFYLSLIFAARLFPCHMNPGTYDLYWRGMERTRGWM